MVGHWLNFINSNVQVYLKKEEPDCFSLPNGAHVLSRLRFLFYLLLLLFYYYYFFCNRRERISPGTEDLYILFEFVLDLIDILAPSHVNLHFLLGSVDEFSGDKNLIIVPLPSIIFLTLSLTGDSERITW